VVAFVRHRARSTNVGIAVGSIVKTRIIQRYQWGWADTPAAIVRMVCKIVSYLCSDTASAAIRRAFGITSCSSVSRLALSSGASITTPVMFPPGRVILVAKPAATGSPVPNDITIGIVPDAAFAASIEISETATIASRLLATSARANSGICDATPARASITLSEACTSLKTIGRNALCKERSGNAGQKPDHDLWSEKRRHCK
jgi:hypothetical protein